MKERRGGRGDQEEGATRWKGRRGGRGDEEEGATRGKERRGRRRDIIVTKLCKPLLVGQKALPMNQLEK